MDLYRRLAPDRGRRRLRRRHRFRRSPRPARGSGGRRQRSTRALAGVRPLRGGPPGRRRRARPDGLRPGRAADRRGDRRPWRAALRVAALALPIPMSAPILEARGLRAEYGPTPALLGLDASVARGEIVALLGEN